jgi:hypothetical protein
VRPVTLVQLKRDADPALHIGDVATLYRRAPTFDLVRGCCYVEVRDPGDATGVGESLGLLLPRRPDRVRYSLPTEFEPGLATIWRTCSTTGFELPVDVARDAWFDKNSGTAAFVSPSTLGVLSSTHALNEAAWWILRSGDLQEVARVLTAVALTVETTGVDGVGARMFAADIATRLQCGPGILAASAAGRAWLVPACLRWIVRELAAGQACADRGYLHSRSVGAECLLVLREQFPHLLGGGTVDAIDFVTAAWLLHEGFNGAPFSDTPMPDEALGAMTALGISTGRSGLAFVDRFVSWYSIWGVEDSHRLSASWSRLPPSVLRERFTSVAGLDPLEWLAAAFVVAAGRWSAGSDLRRMLLADNDLANAFGPGVGIHPAAVRLLRDRLSITLEDLGTETLDRTPAYGGYGSTPQTDAVGRPIMRFDDGTLGILCFDRFVDAAVALPRNLLREIPDDGRSGTAGSTLGRMFEAHLNDLLMRLRPRHEVLLSDELDRLVHITSKRGDAVVASPGAAVFIEAGLQPLLPGVFHGDAHGVRTMIERYITKADQALAPEFRSAATEHLNRFGHIDTTVLLVVDNPISFSMVHGAYLRSIRPDLPSLFVAGIDDIHHLVDLATAGHSFAHAVLGWQSSERRLPLTHHLARLEAFRASDRKDLKVATSSMYHLAGGSSVAA